MWTVESGRAAVVCVCLCLGAVGRCVWRERGTVCVEGPMDGVFGEASAVATHVEEEGGGGRGARRSKNATATIVKQRGIHRGVDSVSFWFFNGAR